MDFRQIAISQFADTCYIPRPTISQILNGRNKKISDELIGKIHTAYPDLSIVWLMFGEGDMLATPNIKVSEAQNINKLTFDDPQISEHEMFASENREFQPMTDFYPNKLEPDSSSKELGQQATIPKNPVQIPEINDAIAGKIETSKKITSIVVFYADNTFQTFNPS